MDDEVIDDEHDEVYVTKDGIEVSPDFGFYERIGGFDCDKNNIIDIKKIMREEECTCNEMDCHVKKLCSALTSLLSISDKTVRIIDIRGDKDGYNGIILDLALQFIFEKEESCVAYIDSIKYTTKTLFNLKECIKYTNNSIYESKNSIQHFLNNNIINKLDIYRMPAIIDKKIGNHLLSELDIEKIANYKSKFNPITEKSDLLNHNIGIITNSNNVKDCYRTLIDALLTAGINCGRNVKILWINPSKIQEHDIQEIAKLNRCKAILMPGGFGNDGLQGKLAVIEYARNNNIPYLGICLGFQLAVIEYCRSIIGLENATSEEFDSKADNKIFTYMKGNIIEPYGIRLGDKLIILRNETNLSKMLNTEDFFVERYRHRYAVNSNYIDIIESNGMMFTSKKNLENTMLSMELNTNKFFMGVQYHPEFKARCTDKVNIFTSFINSSL